MAKAENKAIVRRMIRERVRNLCQTDLMAKNLFKAINEYAISSINYYVGILHYTEKDFKDLDNDIRRELSEAAATRRSANTERLYLPRTELGRDLTNI